METIIRSAVIIVIVFAVLALSVRGARKAEERMRTEHFVVKQMLAFPVVSFVLVGVGVLTYLLIVIANLDKGAGFHELSENDSIGIALGTIFVAIGGFLSFISLRWRMVVSGRMMVLTPFLGKSRTIRFSDVKYIRATKSEPGFAAYDRNGKKLFAASFTCRGYMLLADAVAPYVDNAHEIPRPTGHFLK